MNKNYSDESTNWQYGLRQRKPYSPSQDEPETQKAPSAPRFLKDPRSRIRWKSLIYFIISVCVIHKGFDWIYSLLPFPISIVAMLALTAKLSESWLDSQGFNTLARFLQNIINLSEDQIDAALKRIWRHASLQERNSQVRTSRYSYDLDSFEMDPLTLHQSELGLKTAQGIFLRHAAINKFKSLLKCSEKLRNKLLKAGFVGSIDQYSFNSAISVEFRTRGILGISFKFKNFGASENGQSSTPITGVMQVNARVDLGDLLIDDPQYFVVTYITMYADVSWKEVVILEN